MTVFNLIFDDTFHRKIERSSVVSDPPKYISYFSKLLSTTNLIQDIFTFFLLKEQKEGDAASKGSNVGTECIMNYND